MATRAAKRESALGALPRRGPLLVLLALLPLLGSAAHHRPEPVATPVAEAEAGITAEHIAALLASENGSLSARERGRIARAVVRYSRKYGLDADLVTAVLLVESNARPWARSPKGAVGLMQVMPHMSRGLGLAGNLATIETNVEAGCLILAHNIRRLGEADGISAYFWGSSIRGDGYLSRVQSARERVRQRLSRS